MSGISKPYVSMLETNKNSRDGKKLLTLNSITEDNEEIKLLSKICAGNVGTAEKLNEEIFKARKTDDGKRKVAEKGGFIQTGCTVTLELQVRKFL